MFGLKFLRMRRVFLSKALARCFCESIEEKRRQSAINGMCRGAQFTYIPEYMFAPGQTQWHPRFYSICILSHFASCTSIT